MTANDRGEYVGGGDRYTLDPDRPQDLDLLVEDLKRTEAVPTHVVYLWSLDAPDGDLRNRPFDTLVAMMRAVSGLLGGQTSALTIVTSGAVGCDGQPSPSALVAGAAIVAAHEYQKLAIRHVDTDLDDRRADQDVEFMPSEKLHHGFLVLRLHRVPLAHLPIIGLCPVEGIVVELLHAHARLWEP